MYNFLLGNISSKLCLLQDGTSGLNIDTGTASETYIFFVLQYRSQRKTITAASSYQQL